jgi:WD40 repeat protein
MSLSSSRDAETLPVTQAGPAPVAIPVVAGYEIEGVLGRGGMGVVYRARQSSLKRLVALKMILAGAHAGDRDLTRFRSEAEAVAQLRHPNIVQIYEVGEQDGLPYFSLEHLPGGSLAQQLNGIPWPARRAAELVEVLAGAVHAAHQQGIVHRDLKPANVLLAEDGTPKVTDFGLAKRLDAASGQTQSGAIVGTPSYMAPEQASGRGKEVGPAADVYALGAILYELLTGRPPFRAESPLDTVLQVVSEEPVPPGRLVPRLPRDLETICLKCLQKEPARRYASAALLAEDLHRFQAGEPVQARPVGALGRLGRWCRRNPALAALIATAVLLLLTTTAITTGAYFRIDRARGEALESATTAREERSQAEEARSRADRQRQEAESERSRAEALLYGNRLVLAERYWSAGNVELADRQLDECPSDLYRWEWYYLKRLCHAELATRPAPADQVSRLVAISHDGRRIASVCRPRHQYGRFAAPSNWSVRIWLAGSGRDMQEIELGQAAVRTLTFSADGRNLAVACEDGTVQHWEVGKDEVQCTLRGQTDLLHAVAYQPNGRLLATGGETIKVWDAGTGKELYTLTGHTGPVNNLAFSPDGRTLASAGRDDTIRLWNTAGLPEQAPKESRILARHQGQVLEVAYSFDGRRLASAGGDDTVRVWELATGKSIALQGTTGRVHALAFSPDNKRIATGGNARTVAVWETETGRALFTLRGHADSVRALAFQPDGRRLLSVADDRTLKVWDAVTGRQGLVLPGNAQGLAFSPDGRSLATALSPPGSGLTEWDRTTGAAGRHFRPESGQVEQIAYSADGQRLACTSLFQAPNKEVRTRVTVWDHASGKQLTDWNFSRVLLGPASDWNGLAFAPDLRSLVRGENKAALVQDSLTGKTSASLKEGGIESFQTLTVSPDGRLVAVAGSNRLAQLRLAGELVQVWDLTALPTAVIIGSGHSDTVLSLAFCRQGERQVSELLASGGADKIIHLWDVRLPTVRPNNSAGAAFRSPVQTLRGHTQPIRGLAFSPDGKRLASVSADRSRGSGELKFWDVATGQELLTDPHPGGEVAFSPDGHFLAVAGGDGLVRILDGRPVDEVRTCRETGLSVALSHNGQWFVAAGKDNDAAIWSVRTGRPLRALHGHRRQVRCGVFSPDDKLVATASDDGTIGLWNAEIGALVHTLDGPGDAVLAVRFNRDGSLLCSAGSDGSARVWRVTGEPVATFAEHGDRVFGVAFSPDSRLVASGGEDRCVRVWDAQTGRELARSPLQGDTINALAFSADGKLLGSAGEDGIVTFWDPATMQSVHTLPPQKAAVRDLIFSPDGRHLATAGWDRLVTLWDVATGRPLHTFQGHIEGVGSVSFDSSGRHLASADASLTVQIWNADAAR